MLAVLITPHGIVHSIVATEATSTNTKTRHFYDLVQLGFYFCLRLCEYTKCTGNFRTFQFRPLLDYVFFIGDRLHPVDAYNEYLQHINQIVLTLNNQKNVIRGESVSHFRSESAAACPVRVDINIFLRKGEHGGLVANPVSDYPDTRQQLQSGSTSDTITVL